MVSVSSLFVAIRSKFLVHSSETLLRDMKSPTEESIQTLVVVSFITKPPQDSSGRQPVACSPTRLPKVTLLLLA
jgi:hypothetical protein